MTKPKQKWTSENGFHKTIFLDYSVAVKFVSSFEMFLEIGVPVYHCMYGRCDAVIKSTESRLKDILILNKCKGEEEIEHNTVWIFSSKTTSCLNQEDLKNHTEEDLKNHTEEDLKNHALNLAKKLYLMDLNFIFKEFCGENVI
jgi:hypothetical protein